MIITGLYLNRRRPSALDGPGAVHVDRIVRDCVARRLPAAQTALRLEVAALFAEVIDR